MPDTLQPPPQSRTIAAAGALTVSAANGLTVSSTGVMSSSQSLAFDAGTGALNVTQNALTGVLSLTGRTVTLSAASGVTVGTLATSNGDGSVTVSGGTLAIASNADISVANGNLTFRNNDLVAGFITIGNGAQIQLSSQVLVGTGEVNFTFGAVPVNPVPGRSG